MTDTTTDVILNMTGGEECVDCRFIYYNANPYGEKINDCVCRAICAATSLNYNAVENLLVISSYIYECDTLRVDCYYHLLSDILCYPVTICFTGETVEQIANDYYDEKIIIRINGHLTCALYGKIYDIFDCRKEKVDCFWEIV